MRDASDRAAGGQGRWRAADDVARAGAPGALLGDARLLLKHPPQRPKRRLPTSFSPRLTSALSTEMASVVSAGERLIWPDALAHPAAPHGVTAGPTSQAIRSAPRSANASVLIAAVPTSDSCSLATVLHFQEANGLVQRNRRRSDRTAPRIGGPQAPSVELIDAQGTSDRLDFEGVTGGGSSMTPGAVRAPAPQLNLRCPMRDQQAFPE